MCSAMTSTGATLPASSRSMYPGILLATPPAPKICDQKLGLTLDFFFGEFDVGLDVAVVEIHVVPLGNFLLLVFHVELLHYLTPRSIIINYNVSANTH